MKTALIIGTTGLEHTSSMTKIIPMPIRKVLLRAFNGVFWPPAFARFKTVVLNGEMPSDRLLKTLVYNWGNVGFSADVRYLKFLLNETLRTSNRTVLECGSGLTTLLLGVVADRRSHRLISLEHHSGWYERMRAKLEKEGLENTAVHYCPLKDCGQFEWYDISNVYFPDQSCIDLVICDGPPAQTRGGRVGLPYVLGSRFADGCIIAADDAHRPGERGIIDRWISDFGVEQDSARSEAHFQILVVNYSKCLRYTKSQP